MPAGCFLCWEVLGKVVNSSQISGLRKGMISFAKIFGLWVCNVLKMSEGFHGIFEIPFISNKMAEAFEPQFIALLQFRGEFWEKAS